MKITLWNKWCDRCQLCGRDNIILEKHHLFPKTKRKGKRAGDTIDVCEICADQLHQLFTNKELRDMYNTLESLLANERVQKWIQWVRKNDPKNVTMKKKKKRR